MQAWVHVCGRNWGRQEGGDNNYVRVSETDIINYTFIVILIFILNVELFLS